MVKNYPKIQCRAQLCADVFPDYKNILLPYHIMRFLIISLAALCFHSCYSQRESSPDTDKRTFSKKELQADFLQLVKLMDKHPARYAFTSAPDFSKLIDAQFNKIDDSLTYTQFYAICAPVIASIGCGHTRLGGFKGLANPDLIFPIDFVMMDSQMFVVRANLKDLQLPAGAEILTINGEPVKDLYATITGNLHADGFNKSFKHALFTENFKYIFPMYYGFSDTFNVTYKVSESSAVQDLSVTKSNCSPDTESMTRKTNDCQSLLCLKIIKEKNTALLTIEHFGYYEKVKLESFKEFIDKSFLSIRESNVQNLVIDLRGNTGGNPYCASYLLAHISGKPITYYADGTKNYDDLKVPVPPANNRFERRPFILIDGLGFSTTGHLCALIKYHDLGTFVGQELGSTYTCNDGIRETSTLKNTQLNVRMAQSTFAVRVKGFDPRRGIIPDHPVSPVLEDLISGRDTELEYVFGLLNKQ
jgi:hypothetical protein